MALALLADFTGAAAAAFATLTTGAAGAAGAAAPVPAEVLVSAAARPPAGTAGAASVLGAWFCVTAGAEPPGSWATDCAPPPLPHAATSRAVHTTNGAVRVTTERVLFTLVPHWDACRKRS